MGKKQLFGIEVDCKKCHEQDFVLFEEEGQTWICIHCGKRQTVAETKRKGHTAQ